MAATLMFFAMSRITPCFTASMVSTLRLAQPASAVRAMAVVMANFTFRIIATQEKSTTAYLAAPLAMRMRPLRVESSTVWPPEPILPLR